MRSEQDIDRMIEKLRLAWHNFPEQRLCQLVWNIANNSGQMKSRDCFHVSDDSFEIELNRWFGKSANSKGRLRKMIDNVMVQCEKCWYNYTAKLGEDIPPCPKCGADQSIINKLLKIGVKGKK